MGEVIKRFPDGSWVERTWHIPGEEPPPALCWYDKDGDHVASVEEGGELERNLREYYASDAMEALRLYHAAHVALLRELSAECIRLEGGMTPFIRRLYHLPEFESASASREKVLKEAGE